MTWNRRTDLPSGASLLMAALALSLTGCAASLEYGEPEAPTAEQVEAARMLEEIAVTANASRRGELGPQEAFAVHSKMLVAQQLAVLDSLNPIEATGEIPSSDWDACVDGSAVSNWTYKICEVPNGNINGRIDMRAFGVDYDVRLTGGPDAMIAFNLLGDLDIAEGRILGTLEMRSQITFATDEEIAGVFTGNVVGDVNTVSTWDVRFDETQGCLAGGSVDVQVEAKGELRGARFLFDGCGAAPTVQNATQQE